MLPPSSLLCLKRLPALRFHPSRRWSGSWFLRSGPATRCLFWWVKSCEIPILLEWGCLIQSTIAHPRYIWVDIQAHTHTYIYSIRKTTLPPCFGRSFLGHCISCNPFPLTAVTSTSMAPQSIKRSNMFHPFNGECHISHWICWREILQDNPMFK